MIIFHSVPSGCHPGAIHFSSPSR